MCPPRRPLISLGSNHAVLKTEFACSVKVYDTKFFSLFQVLQYGYLIFLKFKNVSSKNSFDFDYQETAFFRVQTSERLGTS